jgi:hypothetical protein
MWSKFQLNFKFTKPATVKVIYAIPPVCPKCFFYKQSLSKSSRHRSSIPASLKFRWCPWSYVVYPFKVLISYSKDLIPWLYLTNYQMKTTILLLSSLSHPVKSTSAAKQYSHHNVKHIRFPQRPRKVASTVTSGYHSYHTWLSWQPHQLTMATT